MFAKMKLVISLAAALGSGCAGASTASAAIAPDRSQGAAAESRMASTNPLEGKPLRYLIGTDQPGSGRNGEVTEVAYDVQRPPTKGLAIAYCNLFDEKNTGQYGPYLHTSDTAQEYGEGQIDPKGPGWERNLREQFARRKRQGFIYIELDNPDAYSVEDVISAINLAASYGFKVIAKNPGLMQGDAMAYVSHPDVVGIIVEKDAGTPQEMDALRRRAGKPTLPVWFVAFGRERAWAEKFATEAATYKNMAVTHSSRGEYGNSNDVRPAPSAWTNAQRAVPTQR
jgi:hypothetical protein